MRKIPIPKPGKLAAHIGRLLHELRIARRLLKVARDAEAKSLEAKKCAGKDVPQ
jgi:hypothetical protein